jgi:ribosome-associated protein
MEDDDFISKTRRKKQMHDLQAIGAALVKLSPEKLKRIEMPEVLRDAVIEAQRLTKHEAVRRQNQYIGKIMREIDAAPIAEQLSALEAPSRKQTAIFHVAEKWRDALVADPSQAEAFAREFPGADVKKLRELAAAAGEERRGNKPPKQFRGLFHALNAILQEESRKND